MSKRPVAKVDYHSGPISDLESARKPALEQGPTCALIRRYREYR